MAEVEHTGGECGDSGSGAAHLGWLGLISAGILKCVACGDGERLRLGASAMVEGSARQKYIRIESSHTGIISEMFASRVRDIRQRIIDGPVTMVVIM